MKKSKIHTKLRLVIILMLTSTSLLAQESFTEYSCRGRLPIGTTDFPPHCGYSDVSAEAAAVDFCVNRFGANNGVRRLGGNNVAVLDWLCLDTPTITGMSFDSSNQCVPGSATCRSNPPETPFELFDYKPFDFYERVETNICSGFCACEGDEWEIVTSPFLNGLSGCIRAKPPKDDPDSCTVGNPCNPATGHKYATEIDFSNGALSFIRYYSTANLSDYGMGLGWTSNHHQRLVINQAGDELTQISSNGRGEPWRKVNNTWVGDADSDFLLEEAVVGIIRNSNGGFVGGQLIYGYRLTKANNEVEVYNESGSLVSKVDTNSLVTTYEYNDERQLEQVTNHYGHSIIFTYESGRLATVTDAHGAIYKYEHAPRNGRTLPLTAVIYPDTTPEDDTDNPKRQYSYDTERVQVNSGYSVDKLQSIIDENGDSYAAYDYANDGRASETRHAVTTNRVGQERFRFDYID